ncbi:Uu.00g138820.m01.CDS01 [Anthostomella pinea]|uniref:Uu.00g138820.m01.CDS01 n=1 Tax=Anthostomella pinea TaxID=933095 RepID=A0AAI8VPV5_9PEZI|nr:Uu.00g138820.m01.CDS01 [Anthostomella pinea]
MAARDENPVIEGENRYLGDLRLYRNTSANIPAEMSTRLWLTGLPAFCTYHQFFMAIRGGGRVYATHVVDPNDNIPTSAASMTFFSETDANAFIERCQSTPLMLGHHEVSVRIHRIFTEAVRTNSQSRALCITGHPYVADPKFLDWLFREKWGIKYDVDMVLHTPGTSSSRVVYVFGSVRGQSERIYSRLIRDFSNSVSVKYLKDPAA